MTRKTSRRMSKGSTEVATRNTVNLDPKNWANVNNLATEFCLPSAAFATRKCVETTYSLNAAEKRGMQIRLIGPDGTNYAYYLMRPNLAFELNAKGKPTGKTLKHGSKPS